MAAHNFLVYGVPFLIILAVAPPIVGLAWLIRSWRMEQATESAGGLTPREAAHPTPLTYVKVGTVLTAVTIVEVAIFYVDALRPVLVALLIALSTLKFALVAMFYMHLKFDSRMFSGFFVSGVFLAAAIIVTLMGLFSAFIL